jgi:hypothetical protein
MKIVKNIIMLIVFLYMNNLYARDCPGDMILWQAPGSDSSDCVCPSGYKSSAALSTSNLNACGLSAGTTTAATTIGNCVKVSSSGSSGCCSPSMISGLSGWWDGLDIYNNGTAMVSGYASNGTTWYDKSGNAHNAGTAVPGFSTNLYGKTPVGYTGIYLPYYVGRFISGTNAQGFNASFLLSTTGFTLFVVDQTLANGAQNNYGQGNFGQFGIASTDTNCYFDFQESPTSGVNTVFIDDNGANTLFMTDSTYTQNQPFVLKIHTNDSTNASSGRTFSVYTGSGSTPTQVLSTTSSAQSLCYSGCSSNCSTLNGYIGAAVDNNRGTTQNNGYIAEILLYSRVLSSAEITAVKGYLWNKWFNSGSSCYLNILH